MRYHLWMPEDLSNPGNSPYTDAECLTAYHEAGYAVMAQLCGQQITEVELLHRKALTGSEVRKLLASSLT